MEDGPPSGVHTDAGAAARAGRSGAPGRTAGGRPEGATSGLRVAAHNGAPIWGGAEVATARLLAGLASRGHRVVLYCNDPEVERRAATLGAPTRLLHLGGDGALHHAVRFARELRRWHPDALLLGTFRKLWLGALAGRLAGVPRVVARIGLETDTPRNVKYRIVLRRWIDAVAFNADGMTVRFLDSLPSARCELVTIRTGVRPPRRHGGTALRSELGIPAAAPLVGSVGRLAEQKRYDRLLRALPRLEGVHLLLVGEGPERPMLEALAETLGVTGRVHLAGYREDTGPALDAIDLFVISSDREGSSNAMLEALAAGVPVVSSDVSGAREALRALDAGEAPPGVAGRAPGLVVASDPRTLADAVAELLADAPRLAAMRDAARRVAAVRFDEERMLDEWEAVLRGTAGGSDG